MSTTFADLIFLLNTTPAIPVHSGCKVKNSEAQVVDQTCSTTEGPKAVVDVRTYRGRTVKSELRSGDFGVCHQMHKGVTVSAGGSVPFLGEGSWDVHGFKVSWSYDGSVCRLYQDYDTPDTRKAFDIILDTNAKKED